MSNLKVKVHLQKVVHFARQEVSQELAKKINHFAGNNGFQIVVDISGVNGQYTKFELARRSDDTPFLIIEEKEGRFYVSGKIGNKHAELFLEEIEQ